MSEPFCGTEERRVQVCPLCDCDAMWTKRVDIYWGTIWWAADSHQAACGRWCEMGDIPEAADGPAHFGMEECDVCKIRGGQKATDEEIVAARNLFAGENGHGQQWTLEDLLAERRGERGGVR